jgi:hypothetical protein
MLPERPFTRDLHEDGARLLILSPCNRCGASKVASAQDGSLQAREERHTCASLPPKKQLEGIDGGKDRDTGKLRMG